MTGDADPQEGSISLFTLGWIVVALMALAVLVGATQVHLDRMRLVALADELAVAAAADAVRQAYAEGSGDVSVSAQEARASASAGLATSGRAWADEVSLAAVAVGEGDTVDVTLTRSIVPLPGSWDWLPGAAGVTITGQGSARAG